MSQYKQNHPFHLVDVSPWPFIASLNALGLTTGLVLFMHRFQGGFFCFTLSLFLLIVSSILWWRDVIREGTFEGHHTSYVQLGLKFGMILFIVSEAMLFFSFFWAFFHSSLNPSLGIGGIWPPKGITTIDPWGVPLLNTAVLLSSGATITWSHHALVYGNKKQAILGLGFTILLGVYFTFLQGMEYLEAPFSLSDSVYGSTFFMATGFHGFHVLIGSLFLMVCFVRLYKDHFTKVHHIGFESAAWYWHFVDVVWIFVYLFLYIWGG